MDTSRTIYSQSDRLSRYTHRIDHLLNKSKSKSKSPYRCRTPKINKEGPMVARIDTYIKYEHSFFVLNKIILFKEKQLMSDFFILLKFPNKRDAKIKQATKFVVVKQPAPPVKSKILVHRLVNIMKSIFKYSFQLIRQKGNQNKIHEQKSIVQLKSRVQAKLKNTRLITSLFTNYLNQLFKRRQISAFNVLSKHQTKPKKSCYLLLQNINRLFLKNKFFSFAVIKQNSKIKNSYGSQFKSFTTRYLTNFKKNIIRIGRNYSVTQIKKPRKEDVDTIQYLTLNSFVSIYDKLIKLQQLSAFENIIEYNHTQKMQISMINKSMKSASSIKSPRNRPFPKDFQKFRRMIQIVKIKQMKRYDEVFQALFENRFDAEQFYFSNNVLNKMILSRAFQNLKQNSEAINKKQKISSNLPKLVRLFESKVKVIRCASFWNIYSYSNSPIYQQPQQIIHKCAHGISYVLQRLYKHRLVQSYIQIKRIANDYIQFRSPIKSDNSSIFIYDDTASFLEQRHGAFEQLKHNYDQIKAMVGLQGISQITSTSFQNIRAIHQIKNRLLHK